MPGESSVTSIEHSTPRKPKAERTCSARLDRTPVYTG